MTSEKIIFLTIGEPGYSRSWTYFNGARKLGANVNFIKIESTDLTKQFLKLRKSSLILNAIGKKNFLIRDLFL